MLIISFSENLIPDCIKGCFVVACTLCAFISLVWLREQIVMNGGPAWLEPREDNVVPANEPVAENLVHEGDDQVKLGTEATPLDNVAQS